MRALDDFCNFIAVCCLANDENVLFKGEDFPQSVTKKSVVISDYDFNRSHGQFLPRRMQLLCYRRKITRISGEWQLYDISSGTGLRPESYFMQKYGLKATEKSYLKHIELTQWSRYLTTLPAYSDFHGGKMKNLLSVSALALASLSLLMASCSTQEEMAPKPAPKPAAPAAPAPPAEAK